MVFQLIISFAVSLLAVFVALLIERKRLPNLEITASEEANTDVTYRPPHNRAGERWKFFQVAVKNNPMRCPLQWIPRQTAVNCSAKIEFAESDRVNPLFTLSGRWAHTPELPHIPRAYWILKSLHPDPVTIPVNAQEPLDVITKHEEDKEAYAWNNEAYLHNWRPPRYKLDKGDYIIKVSVNTQNGVSFSKSFRLVVSDTIEETSLQNSA